MRLKFLTVFLLVCLSSQLALARNNAGVAAGATLMGIGGLTALIAGIIAGVAADEAYCDTNSRFSQKAVIGHHDCSYQICAVALYQNSYYTCQYYGDAYSGHQDCQYSQGGYSQCIVWQTVPRTCDDWGCKDPNSAYFGPLLHRKNEPTYHNSLWATIAGAGVFGVGLATLIPSLCVSSARSADNSPI